MWSELSRRPEAVCLSFNGGKDSTVILHLLREVCDGAALARVRLFHFVDDKEFPEVATFVDECERRCAPTVRVCACRRRRCHSRGVSAPPVTVFRLCDCRSLSESTSGPRSKSTVSLSCSSGRAQRTLIWLEWGDCA